MSPSSPLESWLALAYGLWDKELAEVDGLIATNIASGAMMAEQDVTIDIFGLC